MCTNLSAIRKKQLNEADKKLVQPQGKGHLPHFPDEPWGWRSWSSDCRSKWCGSCWFPAVYSLELTSIPSCSALSNSRKSSWDCSNVPSTKYKHRERKKMIKHAYINMHCDIHNCTQTVLQLLYISYLLQLTVSHCMPIPFHFTIYMRYSVCFYVLVLPISIWAIINLCVVCEMGWNKEIKQNLNMMRC